MPKLKKLLVPIDFSLESEKALRYASSLAEQIKGELIALHVIDELNEHDGLLPSIMPPEGWPFFGAEPPAPSDRYFTQRTHARLVELHQSNCAGPGNHKAQENCAPRHPAQRNYCRGPSGSHRPHRPGTSQPLSFFQSGQSQITKDDR